MRVRPAWKPPLFNRADLSTHLYAENMLSQYMHAYAYIRVCAAENHQHPSCEYDEVLEIPCDPAVVAVAAVLTLSPLRMMHVCRSIAHGPSSKSHLVDIIDWILRVRLYYRGQVRPWPVRIRPNRPRRGYWRLSRNLARQCSSLMWKIFMYINLIEIVHLRQKYHVKFQARVSGYVYIRWFV